jgi:chromosome segregation protein
MRLKKLVLHGFKSFADRTEFKFDQPVTCVVGPNGCGKSNVVDAIKWVLGEQSAKSLRGGAMLDVIFNGADARKASGVAEVELVFENPVREDGNRLLTVDTDDVSVMRRLYRDGTSEYLINQQGGRLKDIKELFLDTGVGVDAYSIIEQGRVARLLEANPVERRQIFEEAAGISRFKVRKKEAQKKLEKVDDNLARLGDITKELESRLRSVKIQAGRARTYQELATRLSELRLQHALHEYRTLHLRLEKLKAKQDDAKFRFDDAQTNLARSETELEQHQHRAHSLTASHQKTSNELIETRGKVQHADQQANYARKQLEQFAEQATQVTTDREAMATRLAEAESLFAEAAASLASLTEAVEGERKSIEEKREAHRVAQLRHNELNRSIEEHKAGYLDAMRKLAQVESRLSSIEIERRSAAAQQEKLNERERVLNEEAATLEATKAELANAIADVTAQVDAMQQQAKERSGEQADVSAANKSVSERLGAAREHRSGLLSRQKMLGDLEARREGISEAVQRVLKQRDTKFPFIRGLVADLLRVDVEHAHVIEAALDGRDQWLVADPDASLLENRAAFEELAGRVNVLRATRMQVIEHLPREEREAIREEQRQLRPSINVVAQSELSEYETDQAVSLTENAMGEDDAGIRFIPAGNVHVETVEDSRVIQVTGRLFDTLASSSAMEGSPLAMTVQTSDEVYELEDETYDWNQHAELVRFASDLVRFEPTDRVIALRLLGKTAVVESLQDALSLHRDGPSGWRYVTKAGDVLEADGTYRVGPLGASMGILSRRSELEAVTHQIAEVDVRISALADELAAGNEQAKALDAAIAAIRQEAYRLNTVRVEQTSKHQQTESRLGVLGRERPLIDREIAQLAASSGKLDEEANRLGSQRGELAEKQTHHQQQSESLQGELEGLSEALRHAAEEATAARVRVGQLEEKQFAARQSVERLEAQRGEFSQQLERLAKAIDSIISRRGNVERDLASAEHQREVLASAVADLDSRVSDLATQSNEATRLVAEFQATVESTRTSKSAVEQELHKLDVDLSEANVRMEGLVTRTQEEIQIDLAARYEEANRANEVAANTENTSEALAPQEQQEQLPTLAIDWEAIATEIRQLKERIARLGNVNLDAIAELDELEHRQADYEAQVKDLADAKAQLEALIEQINADSSVRFEQTFQAVREHFQLMFRKLFGGGKADIVLETELEDKKAVLADGSSPIDGAPVMRRVDPLDAGIEVIARPPGKNPVTLSQLSGGEKAMTCIALLMSIFKAKPSPFCILDEVDAPLDEANNLRFTQIVQEFLSISQFIIITHHKKTMAIADQLYGITQQVHGVSTRVPVRFDQVDNTGRIKDEAIVAA